MTPKRKGSAALVQPTIRRGQRLKRLEWRIAPELKSVLIRLLITQLAKRIERGSFGKDRASFARRCSFAVLPSSIQPEVNLGA